MHIWGRNFRRIASKAYPQTRKTRFFRYETELFAYLLDRLESRPTSLPVCRPSNRYLSDSARGLRHVVSLMLAATSDPSCPATDMSSSPRIVLYGSRSRTRIIRSARSRSVSTSTCRTTAAFCLCTSTRNGGCVRYGSGRSLTFPNGPSFCCGAPPIRGTRCWQCARVISVPIWGASDGRLRLRASTNAMGFTRLDGMLGVAAVSDDPYRAIHECVRAAVTRTHIRMRS